MTNWHDQLGVFDLETTGIDVTSARIVSAHVGVIDGSGAIVERLDWIVDPGIEIPLGASAVHGISTERARAEGRLASEAIAEILAALSAIFDRSLPVVAYNAPYDFTLLHHEAIRSGIAPLRTPMPIVDPLVLDRALDKYRRGKRTLSITAGHYGVQLSEAHDAGADAIAAGQIAQAIARAFSTELSVAAAELHDLQVQWHHEQAKDFQEYMRRVRDPAFTSSTGWPVGQA